MRLKTIHKNSKFKVDIAVCKTVIVRVNYVKGTLSTNKGNYQVFVLSVQMFVGVVMVANYHLPEPEETFVSGEMECQST